MKTVYLILIALLCGSAQCLYAEEEKVKIPKDEKWEQSENRDNTSPELYRDDNYVYIYSEKQLDNLYISITDLQGNIYYEDIATILSCYNYSILIDSLPQGTYCISIIKGSNYIIGEFVK